MGNSDKKMSTLLFLAVARNNWTWFERLGLDRLNGNFFLNRIPGCLITTLLLLPFFLWSGFSRVEPAVGSSSTPQSWAQSCQTLEELWSSCIGIRATPTDASPARTWSKIIPDWLRQRNSVLRFLSLELTSISPFLSNNLFSLIVVKLSRIFLILSNKSVNFKKLLLILIG